MIKRNLKYRASFLVAVALLCIGSSGVYAADSGSGGNKAIEHLQELSRVFANVAQKVRPVVVSIYTEHSVKTPYAGKFPPNGRNPWEFFFSPRGGNSEIPERKYESLGSGVMVRKDGYILTNNHVVKDADSIKIKLSDDTEFSAEVVGVDPKTDLAVIRIKADEDRKNRKNLRMGHFPTAHLADSDELVVGQWVLAIGAPFGLQQTVTTGIVSAVGRQNMGIADYENFIQTDAAINPGNSGGPLVNLYGQVIGINTAIASKTGGFMGIGFAIPVSMARKVMESLIKYGSVTRGWLGVYIQEVGPDLAKKFGAEPGKGALVAEVMKDTPAARAGFKRTDIILKWDGIFVKNHQHLRHIVAGTTVGKSVRVDILRDGRPKTLKVTIDRQPDSIARSGPDSHDEKIGITARELTPELAKRFNTGDTSGVLVEKVRRGSPADRAKLLAGDLIVEVNRHGVSDLESFNREIDKVTKGETVIFLVKRNGGFMYRIIKTG